MAIRKIRLRRGLESQLPTLDVGEPGFTTDTKRFFIGSATGNIEYPSLTAVQALIDNLDLSEIEGLATEEYVDNAISAIPTTDLTGLATEEYVDNAIAAIGESLPPYRGFKAHYGKLYGNDPSINRLVIYKEAAENPTSSVDTSTEDDLFVVEGLSGTDFVALVNLYGSSSSAPISNAVLMAFLEVFVDNIILNEDGILNSIEQMKESFYDKFEMLAGSLPEGTLTGNFEFFEDRDFLITPNLTEVNQGSGLEVELYYNFEDNFWDGYDIYSSGSGYQVNDEITISGTYFLNGSSPENDITLTITEIGGNGEVTSFTTSGVPLVVFPINHINDGGDDQYDGGNFISTNLTAIDQDNEYTGISYNNGNIVNDSTDFGGEGASYVVTYQDSIFALFATNIDIESIKTDGNSGTDGNGTTLTGSLFDPSTEVPSFGNFAINGSTISSNNQIVITNETNDEVDLYIRAGDDLYLDAYDDDVHIRASDDVRIKAGVSNFEDDNYQSQWRFTDDGSIFFPNSSEIFADPNNILDVYTSGFKINTPNGDWNFTSNGELYISNAGKIIPSVSDGVGLAVEAELDFEIKVNDGQGGSNIWSFAGSDITFPDGTVQTTAFNANAISLDDRARIVSVPSTNLGAPGDKAGDIAFDGTNLYTCIQDFGGESYTVTLIGGYTGSFPAILQGEYPQPLSGWQFTFNNVTYTLVANAVQNNPGQWTLQVDSAISTSNVSIQIGPVTEEAIWKSVPWNAATEQYVQDAIADIPAAPSDINDLTDTTNLLAESGTGEWTLATGSNTVSFTVDDNNTYSMWVRGNIPNGIVVWNATVTITNANVPVIGTQYAWNYNSGEIGSPVFVLELSSIPAQIIGTPGVISTSLPSVGTTTNKFEFTINNASGSAQTVSWGWRKV